jgi:hypothetical protein
MQEINIINKHTEKIRPPNKPLSITREREKEFQKHRLETVGQVTAKPVYIITRKSSITKTFEEADY